MKPTGVSLRLYDDYGNVMCVMMDDYVYTCPQYDLPDVAGSQQEVIAAVNVTRPVDCVYTKNRLYYLNRPDPAVNVSPYSRNVLQTYEGINSLFVDADSLVGSVKEAYNMVAFQDYVLIVSKE